MCCEQGRVAAVFKDEGEGRGGGVRGGFLGMGGMGFCGYGGGVKREGWGGMRDAGMEGNARGLRE